MSLRASCSKTSIVVQYIGLVGVTLLTLFGFQAAFVERAPEAGEPIS